MVCDCNRPCAYTSSFLCNEDAFMLFACADVVTTAAGEADGCCNNEEDELACGIVNDDANGGA